MDVAGLYGSLTSYMIILFILTATLILVYEYNLHHRVKKSAH